MECGVGNSFVVLGKDLRAEHTGWCPFVLNAKPLGGGKWICTLNAGEVGYEDRQGRLSWFGPQLNGIPITNEPAPEFEVLTGESVWFEHVRNGGDLVRVVVHIRKTAPRVVSPSSVERIAQIVRKSKSRWKVKHSIAGTYVLGPASPKGSSSSSSYPSSSSSYPSSSSGTSTPGSGSGSGSGGSGSGPLKTAIFPHHD